MGLVAVGGGMKVVDRGWKKLREQAKKLAGQPHVKVGVLASQGGDAPHEGGEISMVGLAAVHEFGSPSRGIPERSFLRSAFAGDGKKSLAKTCARLYKQVLSGKMTTKQALEVLGQWAAARVKRGITAGEGIPPPLKPETIKRKGSSRTLVDTGQLVNSITYEVVEK